MKVREVPLSRLRRQLPRRGSLSFARRGSLSFARRVQQKSCQIAFYTPPTRPNFPFTRFWRGMGIRGRVFYCVAPRGCKRFIAAFTYELLLISQNVIEIKIALFVLSQWIYTQKTPRPPRTKHMLSTHSPLAAPGR